MILVLDNYDSFTYNLVDYFEQLGVEVEVIRNDMNPKEIDFSKYEGLVLSPGPETPEKANFLLQYVSICCNNLPILGVCLGHQAINVHFGGSLKKGIRPMHGKVSKIECLRKDSIFYSIPENFKVVRYHSLEIDILGNGLEVIGKAEDKSIQIIKHILLPIYGFQFHPESILTEFGLKILENWLKMAGISNGKS